jgi:ArsR family transcriptional regulator, arsenate/arsenite/antimonite-responsive transcriptional repressor
VQAKAKIFSGKSHWTQGCGIKPASFFYAHRVARPKQRVAVVVRKFYIFPLALISSCDIIIRYMANYKNEIKNVLTAFKALGDLTRLRILMSLRGGKLCVCQIIALIGLAPSTVSKHLSILYQAELVEVDKRGRWIYYRLSPAVDRRLMKWLEAALANDEKILADAQTLEKILKEDPEKLCQKIRKV